MKGGLILIKDFYLTGSRNQAVNFYTFNLYFLIIMKAFLKSSFGLVLLFILLVIIVLSVIPTKARAQTTNFYFLIGLIQESNPKSITLEFNNFTERSVTVDPRLSVYFGADSVWLNGPNKEMKFKPNEKTLITFTTEDEKVDMSEFKNKYVSVLYTITPHYQLRGQNVVATKPIDGQYLRLELTLPVELIGFHGKRSGLYNELEWVTASEKNADYFNVERSLDGKTFTKVGKVQAAGNSNTLKTYTFKDIAEGVVYYRLRQIDFDGAFEYSKVIAVNSLGGEIPISVEYFDLQGKRLPGKVKGVYIEVTTTNKGRSGKKFYAE